MARSNSDGFASSGEQVFDNLVKRCMECGFDTISGVYKFENMSWIMQQAVADGNDHFDMVSAVQEQALKGKPDHSDSNDNSNSNRKNARNRIERPVFAFNCPHIQLTLDTRDIINCLKYYYIDNKNSEIVQLRKGSKQEARAKLIESMNHLQSEYNKRYNINNKETNDDDSDEHFVKIENNEFDLRKLIVNSPFMSKYVQKIFENRDNRFNYSHTVCFRLL